MPKSTKCAFCGKSTKTHRKANFGKSKSGKSALKPVRRSRKEVDEIWCKCKNPVPVPFRYADGTHGFDCSECGKLLQVG